jgi:hypothetical protein
MKMANKLYTEEQVKRIAKLYIQELYILEAAINTETPIELPSDEEIEEKGKWVFNNAGHTIFTHYNTVPSWVEGAKWIKDKILNQNNKQ